jgi:hypothetical protein
MLTPSSIIVCIDRLPEARYGFFEGGIFKTDSYSVSLEKAVDMSLVRVGQLDVGSCDRIIRPMVQVKDRSITTALLYCMGEAELPSGLDEFMVKKQAAILSTSQCLSELAGGLMGLGYGLTPSGDDFLVGIALVMNLTGKDVSSIRQAVSQYPNPFSRTMLLDALEGHYSAPVRALGAAMLLGEDIDRRALDLIGVGHSSGSDTLAGVWYALSGMLELD